MRKTAIILLAIPTLLLAQDSFIPIEAGKIIEEFPNGMKLGFKLLVEKIESTNLYNIVVYKIDPVTGLTNHIAKCERGYVEQNRDGVLAINLRHVTVEQLNTNGTINTFTADLYPLRVTTAIEALRQTVETIGAKGAPLSQH